MYFLIFIAIGYAAPTSQARENDKPVEYELYDLQLMGKIRMVSILTKHLPLGDEMLPNFLKSLEHRPEGQMPPAFAIAQGVEDDLLHLPPQYATLHDKYAGLGRASKSILLVPDQLLEDVWKVEEPKLVDEYDNVGPSNEPLKQLLNGRRRAKDEKQHEENLEAREKAMEEHKQLLTERNRFQRAFNVFNFYKLGECLAAKLVEIFGQTVGQQTEEQKQMGIHLKAKYDKLRKLLQQGATEISKHFLQDPRAKNIPQRLNCPSESITDRVDARLFNAIKKNQFSKKEGRNDAHFVDALAIVLNLVGEKNKVIENKNGQIYENYVGKKPYLENGVFSRTRTILEAVQIQKEELPDVKREKAIEAKAKQATAKGKAQQQIDKPIDKNFNSDLLLMTKDSLKPVIKQAKAPNGSTVKKNVSFSSATNAKTDKEDLFQDPRTKTVNHILADSLKPPSTKTVEQQKQGTPIPEQPKSAREELIVSGIVPLLMGITDIGKNNAKTPENNGKPGIQEKLPVSSGPSEFVAIKIKSTKQQAPASVQEMQNKPALDSHAVKLKKYADFIETISLFIFAECVSQQVATETAKVYQAKYNKLVNAFKSLQEEVFQMFIGSTNISSDAISEDVQTIKGLICLPREFTKISVNA